MSRFLLSSFAVLSFLPSASSASPRRLRRGLPTLHRQAQDMAPSNIPQVDVDMAILFNQVLSNEENEHLMWQLMGQGSIMMSGFSMMSMTTQPPNAGCHSAYVYCGQGASTCDLNGGWTVDFSAMHLGSGTRIQCELRLGTGTCSQADFELSVDDIPIGSFEITEESMSAQLASANMGMTPDVVLDVVDGGTRRLSPYEGAGDDPAGFANHLYHDLVFNYNEHSIKFGSELSEQHVAIYATVCSCESGQCDGNEEPSSPSDEGGLSSSDPSVTTAPNNTPNDTPTFSPSVIVVEETLLPTSPSMTQSPTAAPTAAVTQSGAGGSGIDPIVGGQTATAGTSGSARGMVSIAIVAGCIAAVIVAA